MKSQSPNTSNERETETAERMKRSVTVEKARDLLGDEGRDLSDEQIQTMLNLFYATALKAYEDCLDE